ncbi:MAG: GNAT family N-acetyltransferase [Desulfosarcina sp.]|nr:GNAT family N-acetyltransferase [Desulfosarcina sp.]MBC2742996.1 GNAT family N-acetyltransferase [Desulfosarcina sp.]MBC2765906.1 GNAT family N-acetyltransferase [Desulfosarcina sp.]
MTRSLYWADNYVEKQRTAEAAIAMIRPGKRVYVGSASGEPQALVQALSAAAVKISGLEIVRLMSRETTALSEIADKTRDHSLNIRTIYLGSADTEAIARYMRFITPMNMSEVPGLFLSRKLPIHVALIQVSPPDDFGWMSLGVSVDITLAAAQSADLVIAQVNPSMPRTMGQSFIHVNNVHVLVEHEEPILSINLRKRSGVAEWIGKHISRFVEDGSTIQIGLDAASQATVKALADKNDLGFHSQYITDDVMHLYAAGVINNRKKGLNEGKLVASCAIGSQNLYEFINDNPGVDFRPSDYVNDPFIIAQHNRMISMNVAHTIDLTGQVAAEASEHTFFAGVSGIPDFVRGAKRSKGGKSILMLYSASRDGKRSNIVPVLNGPAVVVPRGDVHYVVTEYGAVNLFGKSLQERVLAMIGIAHPDHRDQLFAAAKEARLIGSERHLGEATKGIYPIQLEEIIVRDGEEITIRPSKPVDERRIQEHYYSLDKKDVQLRFFHDKLSFDRKDVEIRSQIDYIKDLTLVAVVGEFGFGKVVGVGEYLLLIHSNLAEVAFSISKEYQGKGLGKLFIRKLARAARENGIAGLVAYTSPQNKAMISLFKTLPYKVKTSFDGDSLMLKLRFDEMAEPVR